MPTDEPVLGWKALCWDRRRLVSPVRKTTWHAGARLEARCRYFESAAPCGNLWDIGVAGEPEECACGIYICTSLETVLEYRYGVAVFMDPRQPWVVGRVSGWGKAREYTEGWRVQYAYPYELWAEDEDIAREVRRAYRVDCGVRTEW